MNTTELTASAIKASENAYAPYSGFKVGAALLTASGNIYTGCNVENASYSLGVCAERNAVFQAVSKDEREFTAIAVAGGFNSSEAAVKPCVPCGACLQVLAEFCGGDFPVILADGVHTLGEFLPCTFTLKK